MDASLKLKEVFTKIENICKNEEIEIFENSIEEYDCYISFKFIKDHSFFNRLFLLREKEYVFEFLKKDDYIILTIGGKEKIYEDILGVLEKGDQKFCDIDEIISFMNKVYDNEISVVSYFNGVSYFYEFSDNIYGHALKYCDFAFDGNRYHYRVNNDEVFYEVMKNLNRNLEAYNRLMKDTDIVLEEVSIKNAYIQEIREVYHRKGNKELFIIFRDNKYYIVLKIANNLSLYQYGNSMYVKNFIPELFQLYLEGTSGIYKEERQSCLGRSFYMNIVENNHKLFIYNVDDVDLDCYISYLEVLSKDIISKRETLQKMETSLSVNENSNNYGFVNIFLLSIGVLIIGIFVFLITLNLLK